MKFNKYLILLIIISITAKLFFIFLNSHNNIAFEQDEYSYYAQSLLDGSISSESFSDYSKRLLPGYPLLMIGLLPIAKSLTFSGFIISFLASIGCVLLFFKITKNFIASFLYAVFPPIWIEQSIKISTEPISAFFQLLGILLYLRNRFFLTGLIIGLAFDIRIISVFLLLGLCLVDFFAKKYRNILKMVLGFFLPLILLAIYNLKFFGSEDLLEQFVHGERYGGVRIGFTQLYNDIFRTIDWGQYRILFSGSFYLLISFVALYSLYKNRKKSKIISVMFYWAILSTLFLFSVSPFTFIENYSRYSLPYYSAIILGLVLVFEKYLHNKTNHR